MAETKISRVLKKSLRNDSTRYSSLALERVDRPLSSPNHDASTFLFVPCLVLYSANTLAMIFRTVDAKPLWAITLSILVHLAFWLTASLHLSENDRPAMIISSLTWLFGLLCFLLSVQYRPAYWQERIYYSWLAMYLVLLMAIVVKFVELCANAPVARPATTLASEQAVEAGERPRQFDSPGFGFGGRTALRCEYRENTVPKNH